MQDNRQNRRPHVDIPSGSQQSPDYYSPYSFEITPADNSWDANASPETPHPSLSTLGRPYRTASVFENGPGLVAFPMPDLSRSASQRSSLDPRPIHHRSSKSDVGSSFTRSHRDPSTVSLASSYSGESMNDNLSRELSNLSLDSGEGLFRFQAGDLSDNDAQWHRLVPPEAREALGKREVERQSVMFEVFLAERDYVSDLELVKEVFIEPLRKASPPIIPEDRLSGFISEVFWNFQEILAYHQRMVASLFERQREQHPLVQSVADIILDTSFLFRDVYESYIKHYPLAEACHRKELKRNPKYQAFIQECSRNPRIHKSDLINFLLRPATRLPRLNLVLDRILKVTDPEHPDLDTIPLIMSILNQLMKSTQPGIASAESKVKFWEFCETLVYQKGEIIDMDLYDESRSMVQIGPLARRQRSEMDWHGWVDLHVALLDNFLVMTREETRASGVIKRHVVSRPLPLEYLRLGAFNGTPESRKDRSDDGRLLRFHYISLYPFTVYHASSKSNRRYTLYSTSESGRQKWYDSLVNAIGVHKVRQEANLWFEPRSLSDKFFNIAEGRVAHNSGARFTGRITSATPFSSGGKRFIAVGCATGIYVATRGAADFRKVLGHTNPTTIAVLQDFNKFIMHFESTLLSYSLDLLARVAQGHSPPQSLDASMEKIAGQDGSVLFVRTGRVGNRNMVIYGSKSFMQTTLQVLEAVHPSETQMSPRRTTGGPISFRSFGAPMYVPKDAYDVSFLVKTVAVSTDKGILIVDPTNLAKSAVTLVPDWSAVGSDLPMANLKVRCDGAKPIGLVRCDAKELLVIYDVMGCYITKHGAPSRSSGFLRWETKATSYAHCGLLVLLFSSEFIEVRNVNTGRLVQVIEGNDIRLLHCGLREGTDRTILVSMGDKQDEKDGVSEKIVELLETSVLSTPGTAGGEALWDEWDMDA